MGCDIHFHSEVKIKGKWHHHSEGKVKRSYKLFAKMANVRNNYNIEPISTPKGIPSDASDLTQIAVADMGTDGHSHSWLNKNEIVKLHNFAKDQLNYMFPHENFPYFLGSSFDGFVKYPEDWKNIEDVRYIFFFDN